MHRPGWGLPFLLLGAVACSGGRLYTSSEPPPATYLKPGQAMELEQPERPNRVSVADAVNEALIQNRTVITARVDAAIAGTSRREALAAMIPQVFIRGSYRKQDEPPRTNAPGFPAPIVTGVDEEWRGELTVGFPIYAFGRYLNNYRAAKLAEGATVARQEVTEADIAASVTAAAFDMLETIQQIEVAKANEAALERQVADSTALLEAGRVTKASLLESQVQYDTAIRDREKLESLVPLRRIVLNTLLARPVDTPTEIIDERVTDEPTWVLAEVEREALGSRPELRAADLDLASVQKRYKSAVAAELPEVRGLFAYSRTDNPFAAPADPVSFTFQFDIPVFQGGGEYARIQRARYDVDLARIRRRDLEDQVRREVAETHRQVVESYKDIAVAERSVTRQEEALRIRREEQANGRATTREVLDTLFILNNAKFAYINAIYDYNIALRELHRARGADPRGIPRASPLPRMAEDELPAPPVDGE
ncbi:MAG: TolC family protein [Planctomycetota bacterium]